MGQTGGGKARLTRRIFELKNSRHQTPLAEQKCVTHKFMRIEIRPNSIDGKQEQEYPNIWTEIPPNGKVCIHTGLKHAKLYSLLGKGGIARPFVRVANLRVPKATQGKTLFHVGDMLRFLDNLAIKQGAGELRHQSKNPVQSEGSQVKRSIKG